MIFLSSYRTSVIYTMANGRFIVHVTTAFLTSYLRFDILFPSVLPSAYRESPGSNWFDTCDLILQKDHTLFQQCVGLNYP